MTPLLLVYSIPKMVKLLQHYWHNFFSLKLKKFISTYAKIPCTILLEVRRLNLGVHTSAQSSYVRVNNFRQQTTS